MKNSTMIVLMVILVVVAIIILFLTISYGGNLFNNQTNQTTQEKIIALGDCVDVNYIGRYSSNNTIFNSSYSDPLTKTGGIPLKVFMSWNQTQQPPTGYENYSGNIKGLIEGLVGLKEGDSETIGPIAPVDAYGVYPKKGDILRLIDPSTKKNITIHFIDIIPNTSMPAEYIDYYGAENTTLFVLRYDYYTLGERTTMYPCWENATVVTKINDTMVWMYTTPSEDQMTNFTWTSTSSDGYYKMIYPENRSSVTNMTESTITITQNPQIGDTILQFDNYYGVTYNFTVEKVTDEIINVSYYDLNVGSTSYYEFNRTTTIMRNESQNTTFTYPTPLMAQVLSLLKSNYDSNIVLSVNQLADKYLIYEVQIVKIYKTS
jgi:hypothetical protein